MKPKSIKNLLAAAFVVTLPLLASPRPAQAESLRSFCKYVPNDNSSYTVARPCVFSMRQGLVDIIWDDGVINSFVPNPEQPFTYTDQRGGLVYQQSSTANKTYQMEQGNLYVYWGGDR